jgi:hypothetical protein
MAVRTPVYWDATLNSNAGGLRQMSSAQITAIATETARQYALSPSVTLSMSSGTTLATQTDNYRVAGADSTDVSSYQTPGATGTGALSFILKQTVASVSSPSVAGRGAPLYWTGTRLQKMSKEDMNDTFVDPAIDILVAASGPGTHYTSTSGSTVLFTDRNFNNGTYSNSTYVDDDDTQTVTYTEANNTYYLNTYATPSEGTWIVPVGWNTTDSRIQPQVTATWATLLQDLVRYRASLASGGGIRYAWQASAPSGATVNSRGSTVDQQLDGTTQFNKFIGADDYRSRNFPTGSLTTTETFTLYIIKNS